MPERIDKPSEGVKLTNSETIRDAFAWMAEGTEFVFNDRANPLVVTGRDDYNLSLVAKVGGKGDRKAHEFYWSPKYDRPKHKPRSNQTNNVKTLIVKSYEPLRGSTAGIRFERLWDGSKTVAETGSVMGRHLEQAEVGDEFILNDRKRALRVREVALKDDWGEEGKKHIYLVGNGVSYMIELDLSRYETTFVRLKGADTTYKDLGGVEFASKPQ